MAAGRLERAGIEAPRLEAQLLATHVLGRDRTWLFAHDDEPFNELAGEVLLQKRESRYPLAYLLGEREFYGRLFKVNPSVLIPRQETETTLELGLGTGDELRHPRVLDLGTGSGALGVTLKLERPSWRVVCSDISTKALEVAADNAWRLEANVSFVLGDLLDSFCDGCFDLIVSNPPYVGWEETLGPELDYEPDVALYAPESGYAVYRRLSKEASRVLAPGGVLVVEVGYQQADSVSRLFCAAGWGELRRAADLLGHDRAVAFRRG